MALSTATKLRTPRRTLDRLALALLAIGIGGLAQAALRREGLWDGLLLFGLATILFVRALRETEVVRLLWWPPYRGLFAGLGLRTGRWGWVGSLLNFVALLLSFSAHRLFADGDTLLQAWWFYGGSLFLFVVGSLLLTQGSHPPSDGSAPWRLGKHGKTWISRFAFSPYTAAFLLVFFLALILRLWQFDQLPFGIWYDEAEAGLQARRWLSEAKFKPAFYDPINVSGQFLLLYSAALRFVTDSVHSLRLVSVLFGLGGVWAAYLFGRTLRGPLFGLTMAFFLAVMRWDINFSRIAMTGIDAPFFELLTLFFLVRLMRWGRLRDAIFAGLALGLGLSFYTAFRLFVLVLGLSGLLGLVIWRHWWGRAASWQWWHNQVIRVGLLALAAWIVVMPVVQYAGRNPESFSNRLQVISIFNRRDDPNLVRAIGHSLGKHLGMFHFKGDKNGRHNLPGEPMLDPAMGILMVLGLGLALRNVFSPGIRAANLFFLLLLPVSLAGGIFSLDFEAPQSLRSIAVLPAIAYLCALPVASLATEAERVMHPFSNRWLLWPAGLAAFYILGVNTHTYFVRQANDFAVWNAFSTPETITGHRMAQLGPAYDFYLSPFLSNHPTVRFLSSDSLRRITLSFPDALPIRGEATRPVAIFIHPDEGWVFEEAARLYPAGRFETVSNAPGNPPAVHLVELSPADLASVQGLALRYWAGSEIRSNQVPVKALKTETIDVDWTDSLPLTPPYLAEWTGLLYVEQYGIYQLYLTTPGEAILEIDGVEVLRGEGELQATWELARGNHSLRLVVHSEDGRGRVQLRWLPPTGSETVIPARAFYSDPVTNHGLLGRYYANSEWLGSPVFMQVDPFINTYFHLTPLPRPYSVEWTGLLDIPRTGVYELGLRSVGEAQLFVDDRLLVRTEVPDQPFAASASLPAGLHEVKILFQDTLSRSRIHFLWQPPGTPDLVPVPSQNLWPSLGSVQQSDRQQVVSKKTFEARPVGLRHVTTLSEGLVEPRDITVSPQGNIYIADTGIRGVQIFADDVLIGGWVETVDGSFEEPLAIATASNGTIWVLDSIRQWVYAFDETGDPLGKVGGPEAQFYHPRSMNIFSQPDAEDIMVVANTGAGNLRLYGLDGTPLGTVGVFGDAPGRFNEPVDVLRDEFGAYFVTEGANINRWQRVDPFGKPLDAWPLDAPVAFDGSHLAWGPDGSIFMTNSDQGVLRRYGPDGLLLDEWRTIDTVTFERPVGIFADVAHNRLFVSDVARGEVHIFRIEIEAE